MKQRKKGDYDRPERERIERFPGWEEAGRIIDEPLPTVSFNEYTGLMPTPADTEAENLAYGEIETPMTDAQARADLSREVPGESR